MDRVCAEVPIHLALRDWAVLRLADARIVSTFTDEDDAIAAARRNTRTAGGRYVAAPVTIDRSSMPYRGRVEVLV